MEFSYQTKFRESIEFYIKYKIVVAWQERENYYNPYKFKRRENNSVKGKYAFQV